MVNAFGRDERRLRPPRLRQRRRPVRPEGAPRRPCLARAVRGLQRRHRRGGHRPQHLPGADRGRPDRARAAVPDRRDRLREQPQQGRDHRPARAGSRRLPRRLPHLRDAGPARAELRHGREPGAVARPGAADRRPVLRRRGGVRRWTTGWRACTPTTAASRCRGRSSRTGPTPSRRGAPTETARTCRRRCATRPSPPTARRARERTGR